MSVRRQAILFITVVLALAAGACAGPAEQSSGVERLTHAVESAQRSGSYRLRGLFGGARSPIVSWEGFVAGTSEQYVLEVGGMLLASRRVNGEHYARRADQPDATWTRIEREDDPVDLSVLLRGQVQSMRSVEDGWDVELAYDGVDVLWALAHIPANGSASVRVHLAGDVLDSVALEIGASRAQIQFWDWGAPLVVEPVDAGGDNGLQPYGCCSSVEARPA